MNQEQSVALHTLKNSQAKVVTGVLWLDVPEKKRVKDLIKSEDITKPGTVQINGYDEEPIQFGVCSLKGIKAKKAYSAAALFAIHQRLSDELDEDDVTASVRTWIAIEKFDDGYWVCLINAGIVVAESESGLSLEGAKSEADTYYSHVRSEGQNCLFVGNACHDLGYSNNESSFTTLESLLSAEQTEQFAQAILVGNNSRQIGAAVIIVAGVCVLGYPLATSFGMLSSGPSPEEEQRRAEEESIRLVESYYSNFLRQPSFNSSLKKIHELIVGDKLLAAPWPVHVINCSPGDGICIATYKNPKNLSTTYIKSFLAPRCDRVEVIPQGSAANCTLRFQPLAPSQEEMGAEIHELTEQLLSFASVQVQTKISNPIQSTITGASYAPTSLLHQEGVWEISGDFLRIFDISMSLPELAWVKAKSIKLTHITGLNSEQPQTNITIEGAYVIQ